MTLMILAGSAEARALGAAALEMGLELRALVSEPPRGANPMPMPCTLMDFDDVDAVQAQMRGCNAVLDASHGFDAAMTRVGFEAAQRLGLPFLSYMRPGWPLPQNASWHVAPDTAAALPLIASDARVFSATGWASLPDYAAFPGKRLMLRQTHVHPRNPPFDFVDLIFGDPPFTVQSETELFCELDADTLICRNLGGLASRPKLDAALALNMKVILIDRPPLPPEVEFVHELDAALAWGHIPMTRLIETSADVAEGAAWLANSDPRFARLLEQTGPLPLRIKPSGFHGLLEIIISQQVSVASANAIRLRMADAGINSEATVRAAGDVGLRAAGLSRPKARYALILADAAIDYDGLCNLADDAVMARLTHVTGIGPWTAQIYVMFCMGRADVFPPGDLALQEAARVLFGLSTRPTPQELAEMATKWSPWRSVAARALFAYYRIVKQREGLG